jgi:hypothetical protein
MPRGFDVCRRKGGKVRTVSLPSGRYFRVCYLDGKSFKGYVKRKGKPAMRV